jgi:AAA family ATP:ADP antiporter
MKRWLERALSIQPGDLGRGLLLTSCLFLVMGSYVIGRVARDALFLATFQAVQLPYADIASGVLGGFVVVGYLRLVRRISLHSLLIGSQFFFATTCSVFWAFADFYHPTWLYAAFYIWVSIFGVLAPTQVWTLANHMLTTREAKSVFGMVGAGAILGSIFAGFVAVRAAKAWGTESLLLVMAIPLAVSAAIVLVARLTHRITLAEHVGFQPEGSGVHPREVRGGLRLIFSSNYLRAVATIICISSLVTTVTGWQFKAMAQEFFTNKEHLVVFFGDFYFYAGILGLFFQLLLTARFLRRFRIGTMLLLLPVLIFIGSSALLIWGTLTAVILLRGSDQILRYSLDKSAVELLYLPLSRGVKLRAKWFIDTVIWRVGDGLGGLIVLVFATHLHVETLHISYVIGCLTLGWLAAAFYGGRQYLVLLRESLNQHRLYADQISSTAIDRSTSELLTAKLQSSNTEEVLYALALYQEESAAAPQFVIRDLLRHSSKEIRRNAIAILSGSSDKSVLPAVEGMLKDSAIEVRTAAMLYLVQHAHADPLVLLQESNEFEDFSIRSAVAAFLAQPGEAQDIATAKSILKQMTEEIGQAGGRSRLEAARLLGSLPDVFDPLLSQLLIDPSTDVVRESIESVGRLRKLDLAPLLLKQFHSPLLHETATQALVAQGDSVIQLLSDRLGDPKVAAVERRAIPFVLKGIGTPASAHVLLENVMEGDTTLRFEIITALNKLHRDHPEIPLDTQKIETVLAAEILGHYRTYQVMDAVSDPSSSDDVVGGALASSLRQELERIFRLLGLLYAHIDLYAVYIGLQSENKTVYDNALEFLENVMKPALRVTLIPLLDGRVTTKERVRLADQFVRTKLENREQAVDLLVSSEDPWLKSCGAYAIGSFRMKSMASALAEYLDHSDPLLRETARSAKLRLDEDS